MYKVIQLDNLNILKMTFSADGTSKQLYQWTYFKMVSREARDKGGHCLTSTTWYCECDI